MREASGDHSFVRHPHRTLVRLTVPVLISLIAATGLGSLLLLRMDLTAPGALAHIWVISGIWIGVRSVFGVARIWPGIGHSPCVLRVMGTRNADDRSSAGPARIQVLELRVSLCLR